MLPRPIRLFQQYCGSFFSSKKQSDETVSRFKRPVGTLIDIIKTLPSSSNFIATTLAPILSQLIDIQTLPVAILAITATLVVACFNYNFYHRPLTEALDKNHEIIQSVPLHKNYFYYASIAADFLIQGLLLATSFSTTFRLVCLYLRISLSPESMLIVETSLFMLGLLLQTLMMERILLIQRLSQTRQLQPMVFGHRLMHSYQHKLRILLLTILSYATLYLLDIPIPVILSQPLLTVRHLTIRTDFFLLLGTTTLISVIAQSPKTVLSELVFFTSTLLNARAVRQFFRVGLESITISPILVKLAYSFFAALTITHIQSTTINRLAARSLLLNPPLAHGKKSRVSLGEWLPEMFSPKNIRKSLSPYCSPLSLFRSPTPAPASSKTSPSAEKS